MAQILASHSEQDLRSAELSGENEKLRKELERTAKILEAICSCFRDISSDSVTFLISFHQISSFSTCFEDLRGFCIAREVLEQQKHLAEDKMLALEQERANGSV